MHIYKESLFFSDQCIISSVVFMISVYYTRALKFLENGFLPSGILLRIAGLVKLPCPELWHVIGKLPSPVLRGAAPRPTPQQLMLVIRWH